MDVVQYENYDLFPSKAVVKVWRLMLFIINLIYFMTEKYNSTDFIGLWYSLPGNWNKKQSEVNKLGLSWAELKFCLKLEM